MATSRSGRSGSRRGGSPRRWSGQVTEHSDAMDLEPGVFKRGSPRSIARSIKSSAEHSHRRKSEPFRSAMSMLTFYINRAGKGLDAGQRRRLQAALGELRALFHRDDTRHAAGGGTRGGTGSRGRTTRH